VDVLKTIEEASDFFNLILANVKKWDKIAVPFQRGAWLRLYGIPLHAWNESFFKLCVLDCGRYLRTDSCSLEKERFDFARVLVSTTSLEIISLVDKLLIDGIMVEVKIVEEWGFSIGEDACIFDDDNDCNIETPLNEDIHVDPEVSNNVDILVGKIVDDIEATELKEDLEQIIPVSSKINEDNVSVSPLVLHKAATMPSMGPMVESGDNGDHRADVSSRCESPTDPIQGDVDGMSIQLKAHSNCDVSKLVVQRRKRTGSCPPRAGRSSVSGPWSMEWLRDQIHSTSGIVSSSRKNGKHVSVSQKNKNGKLRDADTMSRRTKVGGLLRHNVHSLKKVARLSTNDCAAVLHVLKRRVRKRNVKEGVTRSVEVISKSIFEGTSSASSVNNDWKNWVVLRGNEEVEVEDVRGLGKAIGVNFKGDSHNRFSVLSRMGKDKRKLKIHKGEVSEQRPKEGV
jgi:hypothetical protein